MLGLRVPGGFPAGCTIGGMSPRKLIHKDARLALSRTQGRRSASWLIMAACLGVMMLLWGVPLPGWVFAAVIAVAFIVLMALGNYWAGLDEIAAAEAAKKSAQTGKPAGARTTQARAKTRATSAAAGRASAASAKAGTKPRR